jgi:hypothetical protein
VDGQQRLRTLLAFIDISLLPDADSSDDFRYTPPELQKSRLSFSFSDLGAKIQQRILRTTLPTVSLDSGANDNVVLELFDRLNSTGAALTAQELRYAKRWGDFSEMSYRLARMNQSRWTDWKLFNANAISRMKEVEFTSELLLLLRNGVDKTAKAELDAAYANWDLSVSEKERIEGMFQETMDALDKALSYPRPGDPFAMFRGKGWFYASFATALRLSGWLDDHWRPGQNSTRYVPAQELVTRLQTASETYKTAVKTSSELVRAVSGSSSDKASRLRRAAFVFDAAS